MLSLRKDLKEVDQKQKFWKLVVNFAVRPKLELKLGLDQRPLIPAKARNEGPF